MKRFIGLFLIFVLMIFGYIYSSRNLGSLVLSAGIEFEINSANSDCEVLVIKDSEYEKIINQLGIEIVSVKDLCNRKVVEGYCGKLSKFNVINGRKVNIQMSLFDGKILVGYPLINGSF